MPNYCIIRTDLIIMILLSGHYWVLPDYVHHKVGVYSIRRSYAERFFVALLEYWLPVLALRVSTMLTTVTHIFSYLPIGELSYTLAPTFRHIRRWPYHCHRLYVTSSCTSEFSVTYFPCSVSRSWPFSGFSWVFRYLENKLSYFRLSSTREKINAFIFVVQKTRLSIADSRHPTIVGKRPGSEWL